MDIGTIPDDTPRGRFLGVDVPGSDFLGLPPRRFHEIATASITAGSPFTGEAAPNGDESCGS